MVHVLTARSPRPGLPVCVYCIMIGVPAGAEVLLLPLTRFRQGVPAVYLYDGADSGATCSACPITSCEPSLCRCLTSI
jgi:hypothetical protein